MAARPPPSMSTARDRCEAGSTLHQTMSDQTPTFNFLVFPYRDQYFLDTYGCIVRDLQIIESLRRHPQVRGLTVVNRPVHVLERVLRRRVLSHRQNGELDGLRYWDRTSYNPSAPLAWDEWKRRCYGPYLEEIRQFAGFDPTAKNVLLDFNPIAAVTYDVFADYFKWYDLIDNFEKHNRYSPWQKARVAEKYRYVAEHADLITGVTDAALQRFPVGKKCTLHNKLLDRASPHNATPDYLYGFTGFVTDKFDVDFIRSLATGDGKRVAIYGEVLDSAVGEALSKIPGVQLFGRFRQADTARIHATFAVGLIPYRRDRSHDESPLKLYSYLDHGRPVVSLQDYEVESDYIHVVDRENISALHEFVAQYSMDLARAPGETIEAIRAEIGDRHSWHSALTGLLETVL